MIRIHHATAKKAAFNKVELVATEAGPIEATLVVCNRQYTFTAVDPKGLLDAVMAIRTFMEAYPGLEVTQLEHDYFYIRVALADGDALVTGDLDAGQVRSALEAIVDDIDEETLAQMEQQLAEAEEEDDRGSVVPSKYKAIYAERAKETGGSPDNCGDWLAVQLDELVKIEVTEGRKRKIVDPEAMYNLCVANGCDVETLYNRAMEKQSRGWQGRFRMSAGIKLRHVVAEAGILVVPGEKDRKPPKAWIEANKLKPKAAPKPKKAAGC